MPRKAVTRANVLTLAALLALLSLLGVATWERSRAADEARGWVEHTYEVIGAVRGLEVAIRDAEAGQRTFLLTGDPTDLDPYEGGLGQVGVLQGELRRLTDDNPAVQARLRDLAPLLQRRLATLAQGIQARRDSGLDGVQQLVRNGTGRQMMAEIRASLAAMVTDETRLLAERLEVADRNAAMVRRLVFAAALVASFALGWAAWALNQAWARSFRMGSAQRALALRLRSSLDSLSQGVGVFDADRRLTNWNECFRVLLALPHALTREGTPYGALAEHVVQGGEPLLESEDQLRRGRFGRAGGRHVVFERVRPDGQQLEVRRTPMPDGGFVLTISDMTQRARAEGVLREAQKMQAIGQLTGGIAHDFNNLLTVILGNLEFTRARLEKDNPAQARLERAVWAAQRGATLTAQLLAFARKQPLDPGPIDLSASMPDLVPLLRRTLGEHIDLRFVDAAGLWPAMADAAQLESAVLNLALNARDAMSGGGRLTIELANKVLDEEYARTHAEVEAGDYVMLAVSDTGHGMAPTVAARIFEPFFTTKPDGKGTGLGLAMVWGFVRQSAGHVKVYSEPGEGTAVKIYLPRAVKAAVGGTTLVSRGGPPVELPRGTATVLVVEDEPAVREIATDILRDLGYRVLEAADGEEALRVFGAHAAEVDLLLTDVVLPGTLRGREVAERITAVRPGVRVLYMSGYTENSIVHHGRLDDGVHLLSKPFKREQLARKVAEVLGAGRDGKVVELRPRERG